jgi:hypothetical protein
MWGNVVRNTKLYLAAASLIGCLAIGFFAGRLYEYHPVTQHKITLAQWSERTGIPVRPDKSLPYVVVNAASCPYRDERLLWELSDYTVGVVIRSLDDIDGAKVYNYYVYMMPNGE